MSDIYKQTAMEKQLGLRLSEDDHYKLHTLAQESGISVSSLARYAVKQIIKGRKPKPLEPKTVRELIKKDD